MPRTSAPPGFERRAPAPALAPYTEQLWASTARDGPVAVYRERVLPTGSAHVVFRLGGPPVRLYRDDDDVAGVDYGYAVCGGPRSTPYLREATTPALSVGAVLRPGAAGIFVGVPAVLLAERHARLGDLWGDLAVNRALEGLGSCTSAGARLDAFESFLLERAPARCTPHPVVAAALDGLSRAPDVAAAARACGLSARGFSSLFARNVGLTPKLYCRVRRFREAVGRAHGEPALALASLALATGYADQSHLTREFQAFARLAPAAYRGRDVSHAHHVPLGR